MAHPEQMRFMDQVRSVLPSFFRNKRVLEVGSRNLNGTARIYFEDCDYVGIDCISGPHVEVACLAHEFKSDRLFDVVVCCEMMDHDPYLELTVPNVMGLLKPKGLLVGTAAGLTRPEHGTEDSGDEPMGPDHHFYRGVSAEHLRELFRPYCEPLEVQTAREGQDIYFLGFRRK